MLEKPTLIQVESYEDDRGAMSFANLFLMDAVKRFYTITPKNTEIIRAWQAHKVEEKWFHVLNGRFLVMLVKINNWENPSDALPHEKFILDAADNQILHIPKGYANGFIALEKASKLLVFSNASLKESAKDNYRFEANKWVDWRAFT